MFTFSGFLIGQGTPDVQHIEDGISDLWYKRWAKLPQALQLCHVLQMFPPPLIISSVGVSSSPPLLRKACKQNKKNPPQDPPTQCEEFLHPFVSKTFCCSSEQRIACCLLARCLSGRSRWLATWTSVSCSKLPVSPKLWHVHRTETFLSAPDYGQLFSVSCRLAGSCTRPRQALPTSSSSPLEACVTKLDRGLTTPSKWSI